MMMPYSKNPDRLVQLLPFMSHLIERQDCFWNVEGRKVTPQVLTYRIREGLYIGKLYKDKFPQVAAIADDVSVEIDGERVIARFGRILQVPLPQAMQDYAGVQTQLAALRPQPEPMAVRYSLETIAALWAKRTSNGKVNLPMYTPSDDELLGLYNWGTNLTPPVMLMPSDNSLTLIEYDEELEGMNWTPDEMES
jgi:hypothetical protein